MGSSKKSKDKDREHKKKKKHRSSRSRSRERKERREAARSRSRSPLDREHRADSPSTLIRELKREQRIKEEISDSQPPLPPSTSVKRDYSPTGDDIKPPNVKREDRSPDHTERRRKNKRQDRSSPDGSSRRSYKHDERDRRGRQSPVEQKSSGATTGSADTGEAAGDNLSIDEANALRIKLGLKPLDLNTKKPDEEKESLKDDIHKPAINIGDQKKSEKLRDRLAAAKQKRLQNQKLGKVKGLADSDSDDDALNWVHKQKKKEAEKKRAAERAKLLDQMDEEFGISSLVEKEMKVSTPRYSSRDLKGLKVAHDQANFKEGHTTILTLADKGVLDEDGDELVNVNIQDSERLEKNLDTKKKKPAYNPYDVEDDEFGMMKPKDVLSKYDEEISGPKKGEYFELGNKGSYNTSQETRMEEIRRELQKGAQTLSLAEPTMASEFYTQAEMDAKFKKRKKRVRKVKRSETVKADDLLPLEDDGNRTAADETNMPVFSSEMADHLTSVVQQAESDDDANYVGGANLDDEVNDDYQSSLAIQRKLKQSKKMEPISAAAALLAAVGRDDTDDAPDNDFLTNTQEEDDSVKLTATDEFCRNLGSLPTYGQSGNRNETRDELMDFEQELIAQADKQQEEMEEDKGGWERVEIEAEKPADLDNLGVFQDANVFEEEILLDGGIANALKHATMKGFMETKTEKHGGVTVKDTSSLLSKNYQIEDKKHEDIDEKFRKRGRGERYQGPLTDFSEKTYVPNFNLTYQDEQGRELNQKEAFRILSHKFHGKGSGKKKTEKRIKKLDEDLMMMQMSSTDTPLNTVARLREKQAKEKSAYIVLSGGNKTLTGNSVVK